MVLMLSSGLQEVVMLFSRGREMLSAGGRRQAAAAMPWSGCATGRHVEEGLAEV